ncbi:TonB family protein [Hymenobacter sp. HD11105]|jgi:TonB family protein
MKAFLFTVLLAGCLSLPESGWAQTLPAVYLNAQDEETVPDSATHYRVVDLISDTEFGVREYSLVGTLLLRGTLTAIEPPVRNGLFTWLYPTGAKASQVHFRDNKAQGLFVAWYEDGRVRSRGEYELGRRVGPWLTVHRNGQKRSEGRYQKGQPHGEWRYYYDTGQLSAIERLYAGRTLSLTYYLPDGAALTGTSRKRQPPEFPGGDAALLRHLDQTTVYPKEARRRNLTGQVFVNYTVGEDGRVSDVRVVRGLSPELDNEARRVVTNLPAFRPGREYNLPTAMTFTVAINFTPSFTLFGNSLPPQAPPTEARASNPDANF